MHSVTPCAWGQAKYAVSEDLAMRPGENSVLDSFVGFESAKTKALKLCSSADMVCCELRDWFR